jgi:hypothetical protein
MPDVPCGRNIGHGEYCCAERLCGSCEEVSRLRAIHPESRDRVAIQLSDWPVAGLPYVIVG